MMFVSAAAAALASSLIPFQGNWHCEGRFIASGRPIASELGMQVDGSSGMFLVHHDDAAPMTYHSVEVWSVNSSDGTLGAVVGDLRSGLRLFASMPVKDGVISFNREEPDGRKDQFRYSLRGADELQVDWSSARRGEQLRLGDSLRCQRRD